MKLFTGNKLEILAERLAQILERPLSSPFVPETIVIQSKGMEKWLTLKLAEHRNICAHYLFPFPQHFIEAVFTAFLPSYQYDSFYEEDILTWKIMEELPKLLGGEEIAPLRDYLGENFSSLKLYQLSRRIANLFDQYTVFRPEMIMAWEEGKIQSQEIWQAHLWRKINEHRSGMHKAKLLYLFLQKVKEGPVYREKLPERLTIFGISYLPAYYFRIFDELSRYLEINFFYFNPSPEFWADIHSEKESARIVRQSSWEISADDEIFHLDPGNPLLASWGTAGKDFFRLFTNLSAQSEELFVEPQENNLLSAIQSDIYHLRDRGRENLRMAVSAEDLSIQIHSCHSPLREIETLHDVLLELFEKNPQLQPKDILVMAPSIEEYASSIEAVFEVREPKIPYTVADRGISSGSLILKDYFALLKMGTSRFTAGEVLGFLENPAIGRKFGISATDVEMIRRWVDKTNIRWGIDGRHRQEFGLPEFEQNTWRAGLNRLKLGLAMAGRNERIFEDILPYDDMEGEKIQILGRFLDFFESLAQSKDILKLQQNLQSWSETLQGIAHNFFMFHEDDQAEGLALNNALLTIQEHQNFLQEDTLLDIEVLRQYLASSIDRYRGAASYLAGAVTFCAMLPMRSIPFPVVALVGMNYDSYPRQDRKLGFDLIQKKRRIGDRSLRNDDRYLFLEALLSARENLIVSYLGRDVKNNELLPPSVLLSELSDYIDRGFYFSKTDKTSERLTHQHHLHLFHPEYYRADSPLFTYSKENFATITTSKTPVSLPGFFNKRNHDAQIDIRIIPLSELNSFFRNPVRYYLEKRLLLKLPDEEMIDDDEPFMVKGLDAYKIRIALLGATDVHDAEKIYILNKAEGSIPVGLIGDYYFRREKKKIDVFKRQYAPYMDDRELEPLIVDTTINQYNIVGKIENIRARYCLHFRPAKLTASDYLSAWLNHLILNYLRVDPYPRKSILIGENRAFVFTTTKKAEEILKDLIQLYIEGQFRPIKLFAQTSLTFATCLHQKKKMEDALAQARKIWLGDGYQLRGEAGKIENIICFGKSIPFDEEFVHNAERVFGEILNNLETSGGSELE